MNRLQRKKSKIIKKQHKAYLEICDKYYLPKPNYSQMRVYFNRMIQKSKEDERLKRKISRYIEEL